MKGRECVIVIPPVLEAATEIRPSPRLMRAILDIHITKLSRGQKPHVGNVPLPRISLERGAKYL